MFQPSAFNPLDYASLSESIAHALMEADLVPLTDVSPFEGSGVYALFYSGDFEPYRLLSDRNQSEPGSWPIYVGKAAPSTRKGMGGASSDAMVDASPAALYVGRSLYSRVYEHRSSIEAATNLRASDFHLRLMILSYIWVPMAEAAMIQKYQPLWNAVVDGFGNHAPGSGRAAGMRPRWDTLHPGRTWAVRLPARAETADDIAQDVRQRLADSMT